MEDQVCNQTRYLSMLFAYVRRKPRERDLCDLHTAHDPSTFHASSATANQNARPDRLLTIFKSSLKK